MRGCARWTAAAWRPGRPSRRARGPCAPCANAQRSWRPTRRRASTPWPSAARVAWRLAFSLPRAWQQAVRLPAPLLRAAFLAAAALALGRRLRGSLSRALRCRAFLPVFRRRHHVSLVGSTGWPPTRAIPSVQSMPGEGKPLAGGVGKPCACAERPSLSWRSCRAFRSRLLCSASALRSRFLGGAFLRGTLLARALPARRALLGAAAPRARFRRLAPRRYGFLLCALLSRALLALRLSAALRFSRARHVLLLLAACCPP